MQRRRESLAARLANHSVFRLERFILRGAFNQLLFIAALIVAVSVVAGTIVFVAVSEFRDYFEAVWWGFLRLSDPGYLGDDKGVVARTVSTIVTVLGYVLFMGALIAIMNQGLGRMMRRLESGKSSITESGHILVLGWTNRTATIVRELLLSEGRVRRFLRRVRKNRLTIVVMVDHLTAELAHEVKIALGDRWNSRSLILRSGNPLHTEDLERVDFLNAAAIILPAGEFAEGGPQMLDQRIVKTILAISNTGERRGAGRLPILTSELSDAKKIAIAESAYSGDIEIIPSSTVISRLIAQNVRHGGLSKLYSELLTHSTGNEIYLRELPELAGQRFGDLAARFSRALPLGVVRGKGERSRQVLNPPIDFTVEAEDRLVCIAENYDAIAPDNTGGSEIVPTGDGAAEAAAVPDRRILILGWSHKVPTLLGEFDSYSGESFSVTTVSLVPAETRQAQVLRFAGALERLETEHVEADFTSPNDLRALRPETYDNVVFLASDRMSSDDEADARTVTGYLLLRTLLAEHPHQPELLIELVDPDNEGLFATRPGEVLVSPLIISHMLAHVTLRRDLWLIFEELFTAGGAEFYLRSPGLFGALDRPLRFREIQLLAAAKGAVALGVYSGDRNDGRSGGLHLNPPRDSQWTLTEADAVVVLTTYA